MKKTMYKFTALGLCLPFLLSGCGGPKVSGAEDLTAKVHAKTVEAEKLTAEEENHLLDFSFRLFNQARKKGGNSMISPFSVLEAMGMTGNAMMGASRQEFEALTGLKTEALNKVMASWRQGLPRDKDQTLESANSLWFRQRADIVPTALFLQTAADYYGASVFKAPFDESTVKAINGWVSEKTRGMIPEVIREIQKSQNTFLINALVFQGKWEKAYEPHEVEDGEFTAADGAKQKVKLMYAKEKLYLEDGQAKGFLKPYQGGKLLFGALLPPEGMSADDYAKSLTGEKFRAILEKQEAREVHTAIPKFEAKYQEDLIESFEALGLKAPFDPAKADLSGMGEFGKNNIIDMILHKTYISVDEKGTKAAAVTVVSNRELGMAPDQYREVILNRPFVYFVLEKETSQPLFLGILNTADKAN